MSSQDDMGQFFSAWLFYETSKALIFAVPRSVIETYVHT